MRREEFMSRVVRYAGFSNDIEAESAVRAVLGALRATLPDSIAAALAAELPEGLAGVVRSHTFEGPLDLGELRQRVSRLAGVRQGFAVEHLQSTVRALRDTLSEACATALRRFLPPELQAEFEEPPVSLPPPRSRPGASSSPGGDITAISSARPWSHHPVSEARPPLAHGHSVVGTDNPHADTKLSSARGMRQEVQDRTLAAGKSPGR